MAVGLDGKVYTAGNNALGQLGIGSVISNNVFTQAINLSKFVFGGAAGTNNSFAIDEDGKLYACGSNLNGACGLGATISSTNTFTPVIGTKNNFRVVSAGNQFAYAINYDDGSLYSTGLNSSGQLGHGDNTNRFEFTKIFTGPSTYDWIDISCGYDFVAGIKSDGTLWVVGNNKNSQLGLGDSTNRSALTLLSSDSFKVLLG